MTSPVAERGAARPEEFQAILESCQPLILRGQVADWPAVQAGRQGPQAFCDYVLAFDRGLAMDAFVGPPEIHGKYFYDSGFGAFNFERKQMGFAATVKAVVGNLATPGAPSVYAGSVPVDDYLPGFTAANTMPLLEGVNPRIWIGHASNVSSHYDAMENIACVTAGTRRFTLYPPELIGKLYIGPIDRTMAGQPVSLAASSAPDAERFPLFEPLRDSALIAELGPGDAIFLPKLWWHQVEGTAPFNCLVNYWWDAFRSGPDAPYTAMLLALIAIAERPPAERTAWKAWFDHYVFRSEGHPLRHLPPQEHGLLGPLKPDNYGRLRAYVMHLLRGGH
ncbi:MAG: cupin-like domain-containing protein [Rhizomicrobium sp.]|nr:cupin-like domain-containing protein [Rhizomicrobium sp.]